MTHPQPTATAPVRRRARRAALTGALVGVAALLATACIPADFVKHKAGAYWVWFGPKNYLESHSTYGIDIYAPTGPDTVAHTFNTVICSSGSTLQASVNKYFPARRAQIRDTSGYTNWVTTSATTPTRMPVAQYGADYFRQTITFTGNQGGVAVRGEATLDYQLPDTTYCFERLKFRATAANTFAQQMPRLRAIQENIIYSGPGACDPDFPDDPCPG